MPITTAASANAITSRFITVVILSRTDKMRVVRLTRHLLDIGEEAAGRATIGVLGLTIAATVSGFM